MQDFLDPATLNPSDNSSELASGGGTALSSGMKMGKRPGDHHLALFKDLFFVSEREEKVWHWKKKREKKDNEGIQTE